MITNITSLPSNSFLDVNHIQNYSNFKDHTSHDISQSRFDGNSKYDGHVYILNAFDHLSFRSFESVHYNRSFHKRNSERNGVEIEEQNTNLMLNVQTLVSGIVPFIFSLIVLIGVVGNCLVIFVVLSNRRMQSVTNILILNLAVADLSFIVVCVPFTAMIYALFSWPFGTLACKMYQYMIHVCAYASVYILVLMSLDRFLAVVYPIKSMSIRNPSNAWKCALITWACVLVINSPILHLYQSISYVDAESPDPSKYLANATEAGIKQKYKYVCAIAINGQEFVKGARILYGLFFALAYVAPLAVVILLYFYLLRRLWTKNEVNTPRYSAVPATRASQLLHTLDTREESDDDAFDNDNNIITNRCGDGGVNKQNSAATKKTYILCKNGKLKERRYEFSRNTLSKQRLYEYFNRSNKPKRSQTIKDKVKHDSLYRIRRDKNVRLSCTGSPTHDAISHKLKDKKISQTLKSKRKVTRMVTIVVFIFALSWLPNNIIFLIIHFGSYPETIVFVALQISAQCLAYMNSCMNPILYAFLSDNFRKGFCRILNKMKFWNRFAKKFTSTCDKSFLLRSLSGRSKVPDKNGSDDQKAIKKIYRRKVDLVDPSCLETNCIDYGNLVKMNDHQLIGNTATQIFDRNNFNSSHATEKMPSSGNDEQDMIEEEEYLTIANDKRDNGNKIVVDIEEASLPMTNDNNEIGHEIIVDIMNHYKNINVIHV
ncbi:unnamed protein product [Gordionus sp. m RMFG-2023]|uniref:octopamine receptor-like n=1 Tax=Gordionus sp. m RMFG-2023 TaxID=3053472 RepID=UPI0030E0029B